MGRLVHGLDVAVLKEEKHMDDIGFYNKARYYLRKHQTGGVSEAGNFRAYHEGGKEAVPINRIADSCDCIRGLHVISSRYDSGRLIAEVEVGRRRSWENNRFETLSWDAAYSD